jgi:hypothetical protein
MSATLRCDPIATNNIQMLAKYRSKYLPWRESIESRCIQTPEELRQLSSSERA